MDAHRFLDTLFGAKDPDHWLLVWEKASKSSRWFQDLGEAAAYLKGRTDVYIGCGLTAKPLGDFTRSSAGDIVAIPGLWLDVDWMHPDIETRKTYPPTMEAALEFLHGLPVQPTVIVNSGHGLQAWFLFPEPWVVTTDADRTSAAELSAAWTKTVKGLAARRGWTIDSVFDLTRSLRPPETYNGKLTPVPVQVLEYKQDNTLAPDGFDQYLTYTESPLLSTRDAIEIDAFKLDPNAQPPFDKFQELLTSSELFAKTWNGARPEMADQSASAYCMSLANQTAAAGWSDQEIVDLMIAWRRTNKADLKIFNRKGYEHTLISAKEYLQREEAAKALDEGLPTRPGTDDERAALAQALSAELGFVFTRVIKYMASDPLYYLVTEQGRILLGTVDGLIQQGRLRSRVAALAGIYMNNIPNRKWPRIAQYLLNICEEDDLGPETTERGLVGLWLEDYLYRSTILPSVEEAVQEQLPFVKGEHVYLFLEHFRLWIQVSRGDPVPRKLLAAQLRAVDAEPTQVACWVNGVRTTRSAWRLHVDYTAFAQHENSPQHDEETQEADL